MAVSVNKVILAGRLGADPVQSSDRAPVKFSVATSRKIKVNDSWEDKTEWHKVVVWNTRAQTYAMKYLEKGDFVYIEGTMEYRVWDKDDGEKVNLAEVVVHPHEGVLQAQSRDRGDDREGAYRTAARGGDFGRRDGFVEETRREVSGRGGFSRDLDDEIPF